jgi:hypothetical protein
MTTTPFREIAAYMDRLHDDVGLLVGLVERLMGEEGYEAFPMYGNRACWHLSSHCASADRWRARYITRVYVPKGQDTYTSIVTFLVQLEHDTAYDFPTLICVRYYHDPLSATQVDSMFNTFRLRSLSRTESDWRSFREEKGWTVAEPAFDAPIHHIKCYILNLFDIVDRQHVIDNVILPLTRPEQDLDALLTVEKCPLPAIQSQGVQGT